MSESEQAVRSPRDPDVRMRALISAAWVMAGTILALVLLGFGVDRLTGSPRVCGTCHEMRGKVTDWRTSAHNRVRCPSCHQQPRPWYGFPQALSERAVLLGRDVGAHFAPGGGSLDATVTIPDSTCTHCHDPRREPSKDDGILIDHAEHAKRNRSCLSCHLWTAHPDPKAERPLLLMARCFTCHGQATTPKASGACGACHPKSFALRPASHKPESAWKRSHGKAAANDPDPCRMCHAPAFCTACHGLEMPHPAEWADGAVTHGGVALHERQVCARCHQRGPNFCSMCHHKGYDASRGPWVVLHPAKVKETGAAFCMDCHAPLFCVRCHTTGRLVTETARVE